jgi:hypothetical protein
LGHKDLPRIQNKISNKFFLLTRFNILQGFYSHWVVTAGAWKFWLCFRDSDLIQSNPSKCFMLQHSWVLGIKNIKLPIVCVFRVFHILRLIILLHFFLRLLRLFKCLNILYVTKSPCSVLSCANCFLVNF